MFNWSVLSDAEMHLQKAIDYRSVALFEGGLPVIPVMLSLLKQRSAELYLLR
jgi:hypothetical protein